MELKLENPLNLIIHIFVAQSLDPNTFASHNLLILLYWVKREHKVRISKRNKRKLTFPGSAEMNDHFGNIVIYKLHIMGLGTILFKINVRSVMI